MRTAEKVHADLAANLGAIIKAKGATQQQIAADAGISRNTVTNIVQGNVSPRLDTVALIAAELGCDPVALLMPRGGIMRAAAERGEARHG